ncbi:unnamed protein product, partial [Ixodes pacificus]
PTRAPAFLGRHRRRRCSVPPWTSIANARHADALIGRLAGPRQVPGCGGTPSLSWWPRLRRERRPTEHRDPRPTLSCSRARPSGDRLTTGPRLKTGEVRARNGALPAGARERLHLRPGAREQP